MKQKAIIVGCYGVLILAGGIIGYLVAGSSASLIASSFIALLLFVCSFFITKGERWAYNGATCLTAFLFLFFTYRFSLGYKIAPGGIMAFISAIVLIYLVIQRNKIKREL